MLQVSAGVQLGPVSEWFAGFTSVAAVVTALHFSRLGDKRSEDVRLRSVYAWCELRSQNPSAGMPEWYVVINNQTLFAIDEWSVDLTWIPPTQTTPTSETMDHVESGVAPPGKHLFRWTPTDAPPLSDAGISVTSSSPTVLVDATFGPVRTIGSSEDVAVAS